MKKVLLILVVCLGLFSCGKKNDYKLTDKITETPTKEISEKEPTWKTDFKELFSHLIFFQLPEKSKYETKAEYEKTIDRIKNSVEYKEMLSDTFAMVLNLCLQRGYDAETKTFFISPSGYIPEEEPYEYFYEKTTSNGYSYKVKGQDYTFYELDVKNGFFKKNKNDKYNNVCHFPCEADVAKREDEFKYKVYFTLSDCNVLSSEREERRSDIRIIIKSSYINVNIHKIEIILGDKIIFTITKENQKVEQNILLPEMSFPS